MVVMVVMVVVVVVVGVVLVVVSLHFVMQPKTHLEVKPTCPTLRTN